MAGQGLGRSIGREVDVARDEHWVTVQEAARRLGVKDDAIRKRIQRGTLRSEKDLEDGRVYVYLDAYQDAAQDGTYDTAHDAAEGTTQGATQDGVVVELRDRVASLERMLDQEREARTEERRRHDTLLATLMQRIPQLEASESREKAAEDGDRGRSFEDSDGAVSEPKKRSWWREFFGLS